METIVVNLFGGPGSGKSTGAAYIFSQLKMRNINAELVTEFAKDKTWENNLEALKNQSYIFGKQSFRLSRLNGKVDVIITDAPLINSIIYNNDEVLGDKFNEVVKNVHNSFTNYNVFIKRVKKYNISGRSQTEEEAKLLDKKIKDILNKFDYTEVEGNVDGYNEIVSNIMKLISPL